MDISVRQQAWYLAAHDNKDGQTKLYRIARFKSLKVNGRPMTIERSFSLREFLGNAWIVHRGGPQDRDWHVQIQFTPEAAEMVAETKWHHSQETEHLRDGSLTFRATVTGLDEIKWWVLGWGPRARVIRPKELASEVCRLADGIMERYRGTARKPS